MAAEARWYIIHTYSGYENKVAENIEKIVEKRLGGTSVGFGATIASKHSRTTAELYKKVTQRDLVRYGLIPELVGRLPVVTALDALDKESLVRIMKEPKNSVISQYKSLFGMDNVELEFTDEALEAIAEKTIERHTGARGLRSIIEGVLTNIMFEVPSDYTVSKVIINADCVNDGAEPEIIRDSSRKPIALTTA